MTDVIVFPLVLRSPARLVDRCEAEVVSFPYSRRRNLIERNACAMRGLSEEAAEAHLMRVLEQICDELKKIGIDCEDCQGEAIYEFADAVGKELHGPEFVLRIEGGAE